ncbi:hypothetical protein [Legionella maceachernii]|uniref:hypothetical protein n=1 Tax=Legionella maceachernii TaxID=466 RepID=UPI00099AFED9|nr:hypothetical protein [Legionella maceachernii]
MLILSLDHLDVYFRGGKSSDLKHHMDYYDDHLEALKRHFHETTISATPEVKKRIKAILKSLNISKDEWQSDFREKDLTIYQFFLLLARKGYSQADYITDLIDEKTKIHKLTLFLAGGGIFLTFISLLFATSTLHLALEFIRNIFSSISTVPLIGLFYGFGFGIYNFYSIYTNKKMTIANRFRDICFLLLSTSAKITASFALLMAGATMSPIIAGIFVAGSGVDVIKEIYCLLQEYMQYKLSPPLNGNDPLSVHRDHARRVFGYEKRMEAVRINLVSALLIVSIMALWCFFPGGGIAIAIAALSAIGFVYATKHFWLKYNELTLREHLQEQLGYLEGIYSPQTEDSPSKASRIMALEDNEFLQLGKVDSQQEFNNVVSDYVTVTVPTSSSFQPFSFAKNLSFFNSAHERENQPDYAEREYSSPQSLNFSEPLDGANLLTRPE